MAHGDAAGPHQPDEADRLELISAQELLGGMRNIEALREAMADRTSRLGRLGNAVFPDCVEWLGVRIVECFGAPAGIPDGAGDLGPARRA